MLKNQTHPAAEQAVYRGVLLLQRFSYTNITAYTILTGSLSYTDTAGTEYCSSC